MKRFNREKYKATHYIEPRKPFIIDQVALEVPVGYLRMENKSYYQTKRPDITIHEAAGVKYIHFHDECFPFQDYNYPIVQNIFDAIDWNTYDPNPIFKRRVGYDEILSNFKLRVFEIAFDSYDDNFPYDINLKSGSFRKKYFNDKPPTIYSTDYRKVSSTRKYAQDSLMCIYDRGDKIGSDETITRLEFRLKGDYINGLNIKDLNLTPIGFSSKVKPMIIEYMQKKIIPNSIKASNARVLNTVHPFLYSILKESAKNSSAYYINYDNPTLFLPPAVSK